MNSTSAAVLDRHGKMLERNSMQVRLDLYGHEIEPAMREARERLVSILGEEIDQLNAVIREYTHSQTEALKAAGARLDWVVTTS